MSKEDLFKYFYFIDVDSIVDNIRAAMDDSQHDTDKLFLTMFQEIVNASLGYNGYICGETRPIEVNPFTQNWGNNHMRELFFLCKISLFHHCILQQFKKLTKNPLIRLSGRNGPYIQCGYNNPIIQPSEDLILEHRPERYNSAYKRFWPDQIPEGQNYEKLYCKEILQANCDSEQAKKDGQPIGSKFLLAPKAKCNPYLFLFRNSAVKNVDRAVSNERTLNSTLLNRYIKLLKEANSWKKNLSNLDTVLFDMCIEEVYALSLYNSLFPLLYEASNKFSKKDTYESGYTLNDLNGQPFYNLIEDYLLLLPNTYNRAVFFEYSCKSVLNAKQPKSSLDNFNSYDVVVRRVPETSESRDAFVSTAIRLIGQFFRMLNCVTIPMLEDLWKLVSDKLGCTENLYSSYIEKHYEVISYDYTSIKEPFLNKLLFYQSSFQDMYNALENFTKNSYNSHINIDYKLSKGILDPLCYLFKQHFNMDHYNQQVKVHGQRLDKLLVTPAKDSTEFMYNRRISFQKQHKQEILKFSHVLAMLEFEEGK